MLYMYLIVPFRFASVACQASHAGQSLVRILPGEGYSHSYMAYIGMCSATPKAMVFQPFW